MKPQVIQIAIVTHCSYIDTVNPHLHIHVPEDLGAYSQLKETKCYAHLKRLLGSVSELFITLSDYPVLSIVSLVFFNISLN